VREKIESLQKLLAVQHKGGGKVALPQMIIRREKNRFIANPALVKYKAGD